MPIYTPRSNSGFASQNNFPLGSNSLSDNRKFSPIKDLSLQRKNISQAFGVISGSTTTANTPVPMPDMSVVHFNSTGQIKVYYSVVIFDTGSSVMNIFVDGVQVGKNKTASPASTNQVLSDSIVIQVSPGFHKVDLFWSTGGGSTATASGDYRNMTVEEV
jgi:hypothetical protein